MSTDPTNDPPITREWYASLTEATYTALSPARKAELHQWLDGGGQSAPAINQDITMEYYRQLISTPGAYDKLSREQKERINQFLDKVSNRR